MVDDSQTTDIRVTTPVRLTLRTLRAASGSICGAEVARRLGLESGAVYPILRRLEAAGLVASRWVDSAGATKEGRGPRHQRNYWLTAEGLIHPAGIQGSAVEEGVALRNLIEAVAPFMDEEGKHAGHLLQDMNGTYTTKVEDELAQAYRQARRAIGEA